VAAPFKAAGFEIVWGQGICREADVLNVAAKTGVVTQKGPWHYYNIEIVAVPRWRGQVTLMWGVKPVENMLDLRCNELLATGQLEKRPDNQGRYCWGSGVKRVVFFRGKDYAPVDLFQVVGEAQWGVIYAIRTGPGDFNHRLVTSQALGGACPLDRKVAGGRVWDLTTYTQIDRVNVIKMPATKFLRLVGRSIPAALVIPTPEEEDFFAALGVPCWPPEQRTEHRLMQFIRQGK
jgi:hypothetical protein